MERLTIDEVIEHCNRTCDMTEKIAKARGHELESIESKQFWEHYQVREWLKELKQYKDAEEQGMLLKLPCKVGDTVYVIPSITNYKLNALCGMSKNNRVYEQKVHSIEMFSNDRYAMTTCEGRTRVVSDFYKETWFLNETEAEQALAKMKGE